MTDEWRSTLKRLEQIVSSLEAKANELDRIRATLLVNFGLNRPPHSDGIVIGHETESTHDLMFSVLHQYHDKVQSLNLPDQD